MVGLSQTEAKFFRYIVTRFGSLHAALVTAGIPTKSKPQWNKRSVIEAIRVRNINGPDLSTTWNDDKPLFNAASNHFGGWKAAVKAAGIRFEGHEKWTKERVLEALRKSYHGQSFNDVDRSLVAAANRCFGGFYIAVEAAGLEIPTWKWSKQRIIRLIQEHYVQGHGLGSSGFGDRLFTANAKRYFGSWREAVKAAGLESRMPPSLPKRSWTAEDVLKEIRLTAESGGKISQARKDWGLFSNAVKHFGSWRKATLAAGCEPPQRSWTKDLVIKAVQERHRRDLPVNSLIYKQDPSLAATANSYFGSWRAALVAAGIRQKQVPRLKSSARQVQIAARLDTLEQTIGVKQSRYVTT